MLCTYVVDGRACCVVVEVVELCHLLMSSHLHGRRRGSLVTHSLPHLCLLSVNALVIHVMDRSALRLGRFQPIYVDTTELLYGSMHAWSVGVIYASMHACN